jgi:hypothetical protein
MATAGTTVGDGQCFAVGSEGLKVGAHLFAPFRLFALICFPLSFRLVFNVWLP